MTRQALSCFAHSANAPAVASCSLAAPTATPAWPAGTGGNSGPAAAGGKPLSDARPLFAAMAAPAG